MREQSSSDWVGWCQAVQKGQVSAFFCRPSLFFLHAGIFFIVPCIDTYRKVDLRVVSFDVPPQEVHIIIRLKTTLSCFFQILSKDSVTVAVDAVVYFRISNAVSIFCADFLIISDSDFRPYRWQMSKMLPGPQSYSRKRHFGIFVIKKIVILLFNLEIYWAQKRSPKCCLIVKLFHFKCR